MKKVIVLAVLTGISGLIFLSPINALSPTPTDPKGQEMTYDTNCIMSKLLNYTTVPNPSSQDYWFSKCSRTCPRYCLYESRDNWTIRKNGYCYESSLKQGEYVCMTLDENQNIAQTLNQVNFLGIQIDRAPLVLVRRIMLGVFGAAGLLIIVLGLYATYKFSFSEGKEDKIQEAVGIFKSLIIGSIILFAGVVIVQVVAVVTGVTGSLTDFNFMPRTGRVIYLYPDDLGKACLKEQVFDPTGGEQYICDPVNFVWTK